MFKFDFLGLNKLEFCELNDTMIIKQNCLIICPNQTHSSQNTASYRRSHLQVKIKLV